MVGPPGRTNTRYERFAAKTTRRVGVHRRRRKQSSASHLVTRETLRLDRSEDLTAQARGNHKSFMHVLPGFRPRP